MVSNFNMNINANMYVNMNVGIEMSADRNRSRKRIRIRTKLWTLNKPKYQSYSLFKVSKSLSDTLLQYYGLKETVIRQCLACAWSILFFHPSLEIYEKNHKKVPTTLYIIYVYFLISEVRMCSFVTCDRSNATINTTSICYCKGAFDFSCWLERNIY